nr:MAG TPA: hypothetical protein [Caudoviricetes sp.]
MGESEVILSHAKEKVTAESLYGVRPLLRLQCLCRLLQLPLRHRQAEALPAWGALYRSPTGPSPQKYQKAVVNC